MILKALYDYYNRSLLENPNSLPLYGWMNSCISFVIIIQKNGNFVRLEDNRDETGKGKIFVLPYGVHTNSITPFLFWDKCMYAIDYSKASIPLSDVESQDKKKVEKWEKSYASAHEKHLAFVSLCKKVYDNTLDEDFKAVVEFYKKNQLPLLRNDILWQQIEKDPDVNVSFKLEGAISLIASKPILSNYVEKDTSQKGICLITGNKTDIVRKVTPTPILNCKSSASLVSFQTNQGYDSYGKSQAYNAPISYEAEFAFSTAIKRLIEEKSQNKFTIGKANYTRTFLFWSSSNSDASKAMENGIFTLFAHNELEDEDPNKRIELVKNVFMSIYNGKLSANKDDKFFILGLAPNAARIAVVYWSEIPLREFAKVISQHFKDMAIIGTRKEKKPYIGLYSILESVSLEGKLSNVTPNLPEAVVKSIFQGLPYPNSLFQACIRRIRAEQSINIVRAAIIKAYLNRLNNNNKKINIMLDKENQNEGYLCGRLFAVLENLQYAANKQDSIRSNYMNAASSTPASVFPTILKLSNSHYSKLVKDKKGLAVFFDNKKKEIMAMIQDFPNALNLGDQGRFFLGYYHQKNDKEINTTEE